MADVVEKYKDMLRQAKITLDSAIARLDETVGTFADGRFKDQLSLYKQQMKDRYGPQIQKVLNLSPTDPWWQDQQKQVNFAAQIQAFDEQIKATTVSAGIGFWDGFADTLANRAKKMWDPIDTTISLIPWIIGIVVLGPLVLRAFAGYKEGGASGAAKAAAEGIEEGRRKAWEGGKSLARRVASGGVLRGMNRRSRR